MPEFHAKLSPSAAERWINCPASIRMETLVPKDEQDGDSPYAREGTLAHTLAELETGRLLGLIDGETYARGYDAFLEDFETEDYPAGTLDEMIVHARAYAEFIEKRQSVHPNTQVLLEQQMESGVPGCWGTSDAVLVSPTHVEIVDFKYGAGVQVPAPGNPQLRLYGCGAMDTFGDLLGDVETVTVTVFQPRMNHYDSETLTPEDLRAWRDGVVLPAAEETQREDARFGPSEDACRWCPAKNICTTRVAVATREDFGDVFADDESGDFVTPARPETLTPEMMAEVLKRVPLMKQWLAEVEKAALEMAYTRGEKIPGYKVVRSGGRRVITDEALAIQTLIDYGFKPEDVATFKIKGFGELDKLIKKVLPQDSGKKPLLSDVIGEYIGRTEGKESLVPEDDKREAISPASEAAEDFKEVE